MSAQPDLNQDSEVLQQLARDKDLNIVLTAHAEARMTARGMTLADISAVMRNGEVMNVSSSAAGSNWRARGRTLDGAELELILSVSEPTKTLRVLSVYAADALEEIAGPSPDFKTVELRTNDWAKRIEGLYQTIGEWLPSSWKAERHGTVQMLEEPMKSVGLPPRELPRLGFLHDAQFVGFIEPRGLWIIGANGRLDLSLRGQRWVIVDTAETFDTPKWHYAPLSSRQQLKPLNRENFQTLL